MIFSIALILISGVALGGIFKKIKMPSMIAYLIIGVVLGPYALDLLSHELVGNPKLSILGISPDLREIALTIILLRSGLELDVTCLKTAGRSAIFMCFIPAIFEIAAIVVFGPIFFGMTWLESAILGCILGAVSPAIISPRLIKIAKEGYGNKKGIPQVLLLGASMDDIFCLVIFASFMSQHSSGAFSAIDLLKIPSSIIISIAVGILIGIVIVKLLKKLELNSVTKIILFLGLSLALVAIEELFEAHDIKIPFSGLLSVVTLGSVVYKMDGHLSEEVSEKMGSIWTFMEIILFVLVGASLDLNLSGGKIVGAVLLVVVGLVIRSVGVYVSFFGTNLTFREKMYCIIASVPKATVQASLGALPLAAGVGNGAIILLVSLIAIFLTAPIGAIAMDLSYKKLVDKDPTDETSEKYNNFETFANT